MPAVIGSLRAELEAAVGKFIDDMGRAADEVGKFGKKAAKVGRDVSAAGRSLTVGVTLPVLAVGAAALKASSDFESAMNRVSISTQATAEEMEALEKQAREIGKTTIFSASQAADAMDMLAKNGLETTEILNGAAKATVDLAAATGSELEPAAAAVTDSMRQFKLTAADLPLVVNTITGAVNKSKLDFNDYRLAMGQAGGVAANVGVNFEDFNVALAATSPLFASGSDAGTSFKTFLTKLIPQTDKAAALMKGFGLEFFDASGKMKPMAAIAEELRTSLAHLDDESRNFILTEIFGTDAMRTAIGLMDQGAAGFEKVRGEIQKVDAAAQAAKRMEGFNGQMEQLKGAIEELGIALGESGLLEWATEVVKALADFIDRVSELNPELLKWVAILAGVAAIVGPVLLVIGSLATGLASLITILPVVTAAFGVFWAVMTGPVGLAAAAIVGLIVLWHNFGDEFLNGCRIIGQAVAALYHDVKAWLGDKLGKVLAWIGDRVRAFIKPFKDLYEAVVGHSYVPDMVKGVLAQYGLLEKKGSKKIKNHTDQVAEAFRDLADRVAKGLDDANLPEAVEKANELRRRLKDIEDDAKSSGVGLAQFADEIGAITRAIAVLEKEGLGDEARRFAGDVEKAKRAVREFGSGSLPPLEAALQEVDNRYESLRQRILDEIEANSALADVNEDAARSMATLQQQLLLLEQGHKAATDAAKAQHAAEQQIADLRSAQEEGKLQEKIDDMRRATGASGLETPAAREMREAESALARERLAAVTELRELEAAKAEAERIGDTEEMARLTRLIELAGIYYETVSAATAEQVVAAGRLQESFDGLVDGLTSELTDMVADWEFDLEGIRDVFKQFAKDQFIKPGMDALGGLIKSGAGAFFKSFAGGFAVGGTLKRGQWGIAGERGPEPIFAGNSDLEVHPNGSGMGNVTQVFQIGRMDHDTFRQTRRQFARTAKEAIGG